MTRFTFRLCLTLGKTKRELFDSLEAGELQEWLAFYNVEPFGEEWHQTGDLLAQTYNLNRAEGKPALTAEQFMPGAFHRKPKTFSAKEFGYAMASAGHEVVIKDKKTGKIKEKLSGKPAQPLKKPIKKSISKPK